MFGITSGYNGSEVRGADPACERGGLPLSPDEVATMQALRDAAAAGDTDAATRLAQMREVNLDLTDMLGGPVRSEGVVLGGIRRIVDTITGRTH